ncbi:zinc-binding dehydrogenase family oxidoreductase (macronuclear) [Tetrahymena thermophila SB210]|uniref:Zinc-binding dehydrogenase family oxidoreductase n=1 Tax=Tetrahymena thermophila (strain SB210) TaxID=312017 RepID=I7LU32_TETTS|nr:zinc-binding dehydrogenase family oxidoreductase [Tetrahymena thermophila SB210]EAR89324.1 zinc-binding dehydrogenase family oxidoreductase [Tetrahymena thermophila SB210]|eukprot:XP_001009569.1 zinc-binding dehydrogenase family oxidoreductase [Tetrahymena thermophila SB210]
MYKAVVVKEFKNDEAIFVEEFSLEELRKGLDEKNFIVKVHAAPLNPLDQNKLLGTIFTLKCPFTPGSEASGIIVESHNKDLIGKKVAVSVQTGTWKEYILATEENSIFLNDDVDLDSASCGFVNPLTAVGLIYQAQKYNAKAVVNLAAQSALGKMINYLAKDSGLNCLNVIRGDENRIQSIIKEYQNENVISTDQDPQSFQKQFKELAEKLSATVAFDPVGGSLTGQIFNNLPQNSILIVYGSLSQKDIEGINGVQVRWANKRLEGFTFYGWIQSIPEQDRKKSKELVQQKMNTLFKTQIHTSYGLNQHKEAISLFRKVQGGQKIIFKMIH